MKTIEIETTNSWRIKVNYRNKLFVLELAKELNLPVTPRYLLETSQKAKKENNFHGADALLHYAIFKSLFNTEKNNTETEEIRKFILQGMSEYCLLTSTRIVYSKGNGLDKIIHNYKQNDEFEIKGHFLGVEGNISKIGKKPLEALLGTSDIEEINSVFRWLVGENFKGVYIKSNSKQINNKENNKCIVFDLNYGEIHLCILPPKGWYASLGVRFCHS